MVTLQECVANRMMKKGLEKGFEQVEASELEWDALFTVVSQNTKRLAKDEFALSFMYEQGKAVEKDEKLAHKLLKQAANQGQVDAQLKMATMENKLHWLTAAAAGGSAKGQLALAQYYVEQKEMDLAIPFYQMCIDQHNDVNAKLSLVQILQTQKKDSLALPLLQSLVHDHGSESAALSLAEFYLQSKVGEPPSWMKVMLYLGSGMKNKQVLAKISTLMWQGHKDVIQKGSAELKFEFAQKSANAGNVHDRARVGCCYEEGIGVARDRKKACAIFQEPALQQDSWAQYFLGKFHEIGGVLEQNWKKAFDYYLKSAQQGDLDALFAVGECYRHGHGTETDKGKAMLYLKKAAEQGHKSALNVLTVSIKDF